MISVREAQASKKADETGESHKIRASESRQEGVRKGLSISAGIRVLRDGKDGEALRMAKEMIGQGKWYPISPCSPLAAREGSGHQ